LSDGAVAAGLLMDSDPRLRAVILQSGFYDTLKMWPEAPLREKVAILRQVWPSHRVLAERSVIAHLPPKLDCSVLIMHGEHDKKMPVQQARRLAQALASRGAKVETRFFDDGHDLGGKVEGPLKEFLRENLIAAAPRSHAPS
jgi:dipeptidyl aminopeptidase/acylaminoacyl peptidase